MPNAVDFEQFARLRRQAEAFLGDSGNPNSAQFATSLESALAHLRWTDGARNAKGESFRLGAGFLNLYQPNALADRFEEQYFLAMNVALFVAFGEFAMFCFTQADFMPEIGDAAGEASPHPMDAHSPGMWLLHHTRSGGRVQPEHSARLTPKCQTRYDAAIYLSLLMARYAWMHELAHAFNGHVGFVQDAGIALCLNEVSNRLDLVETRQPAAPVGISSQRLLQGLELDADRAAFYSTVRVQSLDLENIEGIRAFDKNQRVTLALFAAYAATWLFEEFQIFMDAQTGNDHPPPYLRLHNLFQTAASHLAAPIEGFAALHDAACGQFDAIRKVVPKACRSGDLLADMQDEAIVRELAELSSDLTRLREHFKPWEFSAKERSGDAQF